MQVKNIECQIAQAQLRRYLTGEEMPNTIVTDLETHLRHCPECMAAAQSLRESLKGVLNGKVTGKPVPEVPQARPQPKAQAPTQALVQTPADFLDQPDSEFKPAKAPKKSTMKTLAYSGALAVLLVLMSTVFKDPTTLFGPKANDSKKDTPPAVESTAPSTTTDTERETEPKTEPTQPETNVTESTTDQVATNTNMPETSKPLETSGLIVAGGSGTTEIKAEAPKKEQPKPQPKPTAKKKPAARKQGGSGVGTIRVYPPAK